MKKLRPYQLEGIDKIVKAFQKNRRGYLIADETGLGKTVQALYIMRDLAKYYKKPGRSLNFIVICPGFLRLKWRAEIEYWLPKRRNYSIVVKSYEEARDPHMLLFITKQKYVMLIIDEMHYCKDFESLRTQAILGAPAMKHKTLATVSKHILGLSATPMPQRVGELYPWFWATGHKIIKGVTYEKFVIRWANYYKYTSFGLKHKGIKDAEAFRALLKTSMVRRLKKDVAPELPPGVRDYIPIEVTAKMYKEEQTLMRELLVSTGHKPQQIAMLLSNPALLTNLLETMPSFERLAIFKHQQGLFKVKPVYDYLKTEVVPVYKKFVLFTYHEDVAAKYGELLRRLVPASVPVSVVTGLTPPDERYEISQKADSDRQHILVATMGSLKEGVDLIGFNQVYYAEIDWAPYKLTQTEGRFLRLGQTEKVIWTYFIFDEGVEAYVFKTLQEKFATIEKVLG